MRKLGKNQRCLRYTLDYYTREIAAIREGLGLTTVHILGPSWGAMLAVEYLLTSMPSGVVSLVLLAAYQWHADQRHYIEALPAETREIIKGGGIGQSKIPP
jgi:pimeloyl-ACP methyl ester carboxylesterase